MKKIGKNYVIMTSQICENDLLQKKYCFQNSRHISFKIGWFDFPNFLMYNFAKSAIFHVFTVSP